MAIWIMGGGKVESVKEHRLGVEITKTCYRGTLNDLPQDQMPPRKTYKEAVADLSSFEKVYGPRRRHVRDNIEM